jgi:hypothetical protein
MYQAGNLEIDLRHGDSMVSTAPTAAMMKGNNLVGFDRHDGGSHRSPARVAAVLNVIISSSTSTPSIGCCLDGALLTSTAIFCVKDSNFLVASASVLRDIDFLIDTRHSIFNVQVTVSMGRGYHSVSW